MSKEKKSAGGARSVRSLDATVRIVCARLWVATGLTGHSQNDGTGGQRQTYDVVSSPTTTRVVGERECRLALDLVNGPIKQS